MRIFALSDLHTDFLENLKWLQKLSDNDYKNDILIVAGDISDKFDRFNKTLLLLRDKFKTVFFVPGNHDLWLRENHFSDSIQKFNNIKKICEEFHIKTTPGKYKTNSGKNTVIIMPVFSWYLKPEEGEESLYMNKPGEDPTLRMWSDNLLIKWPDNTTTVEINEYFHKMNQDLHTVSAETTVISFSHFLPRKDMMFSLNWERDKERLKRLDRNPAFNFSRVAGNSQIDTYIRKINSSLHISGHQHRNRNRKIEGIRYVSHCLGYPAERARKSLRGIDAGPLLLWDENGLINHPEEY